MDNSIIYVTYDLNLKRYLNKNGIDNLIYGKNPKSNNMFWVFKRDDELNKLLDEYYNTNRK